MQREEITLIVLALSRGQSYTPVQIQKAMFLAEDLAPDAFDSHYDFQPYDYGPFDREVYLDIEAMEAQGWASVGHSARGWRVYSATPEGVRRGLGLYEVLPSRTQEMLSKISTFVRRLSFSDLVSSIYKAYPHMRERSVFRD
jgi:uncharacterized protein